MILWGKLLKNYYIIYIIFSFNLIGYILHRGIVIVGGLMGRKEEPAGRFLPYLIFLVMSIYCDII